MAEFFPINAALHEATFVQKQRPCVVYQDITFRKPEMVRWLVFQNYFVASIKISVQLGSGDRKVDSGGDMRQTRPEATESWHVLFKNHQLMASPHHEDDAYKWHRVDLWKQTNLDLKNKNISCVRLTLVQPSPNWREFRVENLSCFGYYLPVDKSPKAKHADSQEYMSVVASKYNSMFKLCDLAKSTISTGTEEKNEEIVVATPNITADDEIYYITVARE